MKQLVIFQNRTEAGKTLAEKLDIYKADEPIILALPRGGVPIAVEIAKRLNAPLNVLGIKKVGAPANPEFAIGAVAEDGTYVLNKLALSHYGLSEWKIAPEIENKKQEARKLALKFRHGSSLPDFRGKTVIVADDGLATGMTALAAAKFLKVSHAGQIIFASPVCASDTADNLLKEYDSVICALRLDSIGSVGNWYSDFSQLTDAGVIEIMNQLKTWSP